MRQDWSAAPRGRRSEGLVSYGCGRRSSGVGTGPTRISGEPAGPAELRLSGRDLRRLPSRPVGSVTESGTPRIQHNLPGAASPSRWVAKALVREGARDPCAVLLIHTFPTRNRVPARAYACLHLIDDARRFLALEQKPWRLRKYIHGIRVPAVITDCERKIAAFDTHMLKRHQVVRG